MKILLSIISFFFLTSVFSFFPQKELVPPGTVKVVDNFYFDEREVSNLNWREYLAWTKINADNRSYQKAKLDTTVWYSDASYTKPMAENYHRHVSFNNYPVVGVSFQQATDFCKWRTKVVLDNLKKKYEKEEWAHLAQLEYRLPTKTEWNMVARLDDVKIRSLKQKLKKQKVANLHFFNFENEDDSGLFTAPTDAYFQGKLGIYNMFGNVAEMVQEAQTAMGGGFIHTEEQAFSSEGLAYDTAANWLGFRCVCEIKN